MKLEVVATISFKELFFIFFRIAAFTLGGGAVMLPIMEDAFCSKRKLITKNEMIDILSVVNSLPGVIGLNSAIVIGRALRGWRGACVAAFAVILPSLVVILLLSEAILYARQWDVAPSLFLGVRAGATGLVLLMLFRLFSKSLRTWRELFIAVATLLELRILGLLPWQVILLAAVYGVVLFNEKKVHKVADSESDKDSNV